MSSPSPGRHNLLDSRSQAVVDRLHRQVDAQKGAVVRHYLRRLPAWLAGQPLHRFPDMRFFEDKLLAVDPVQGALLYMLARARCPSLVVEFGTAMGVSTIYLAAAIRDAGRGGKVIGTEIVPDKVAKALDHLSAAGLSRHVDIREGDARETLTQLPGPVDFLLLDGWPGLAGSVLDLVEPRLAPDAIVVLDNVAQFGRELRPVTDRLSRPPYSTASLPPNGQTVVAVFDGGGPPMTT